MNRLSWFVAGCMLAFALPSCTDSSEYANALPDDAAAVVSVNLEQMVRKSGADGRTAASLAEALKGEFKGADGLVDRIADDPSESGLDFTDKVYFFASPQGGMTGMLVRVSDSGKLEKLLDVLRGQQICAEPVESDGCTWTTAGWALVAYTDAAFMIVADPAGTEPAAMQHRVSMLLRQKCGEGFAADGNFGRLADAGEDVAAVLSLDLLPREYVAPLTMGVSADLKLNDVKCFATLDFGKGKTVLEAESLTTDELMKGLMEKQRKACGPVKGAYLDLFPSGTGLWMTGNVDGGKVFDLLCENPTVRRQFENSMMPIDFRLIFNSIKGDMALAVPDLSGGAFIAYADVTDSGFLRTFEELKPLLSLTGGTMTLTNRSAEEYEFRMADASVMNLQPGAASFWFGVKDGRFYVTNDHSLIDRRVPGLTLRDCEWGGRVEGKLFYMAVNVPDLSGMPGMPRALPFLRLSDYITVETADGKKVRMEMVAKNRDANVLRQLLESSGLN